MKKSLAQAVKALHDGKISSGEDQLKSILFQLPLDQSFPSGLSHIRGRACLLLAGRFRSAQLDDAAVRHLVQARQDIGLPGDELCFLSRHLAGVSDLSDTAFSIYIDVISFLSGTSSLKRVNPVLESLIPISRIDVENPPESKRVLECKDELNRRLVRFFPQLVFPHVNLGHASLVRQDAAAAVRHLQQAVDLTPKFDTKLTYLLARTYYQTQQWGLAARYLKFIIARMPSAMGGRYLRGSAMVEVVRASIQSKLSKEEQNRIQSVLQEASSELEQVRSTTGPTPAVLYYQACAKELEGKISEAIKEFRHVLTLTPDNLSAKTRLAELYMRQGQINQAEQYLRVMSGQRIDTTALWLELAAYYHRQGLLDHVDEIVETLVQEREEFQLAAAAMPAQLSASLRSRKILKRLDEPEPARLWKVRIKALAQYGTAGRIDSRHQLATLGEYLENNPLDLYAMRALLQMLLLLAIGDEEAGRLDRAEKWWDRARIFCKDFLKSNRAFWKSLPLNEASGDVNRVRQQILDGLADCLLSFLPREVSARRFDRVVMLADHAVESGAGPEVGKKVSTMLLEFAEQRFEIVLLHDIAGFEEIRQVLELALQYDPSSSTTSPAAQLVKKTDSMLQANKARLAMEAGRTDQATPRLSQALDEWPDNPYAQKLNRILLSSGT